jgi:hypothetical protein
MGMAMASFARALLVLCCILVPCCSQPARALENPRPTGNPGITLVSSAPADVLPGQVFNLSFLVTNTSAGDEELVEEVGIPDGFIALLPTGTISLGPSQSQASLISLKVSRGAPAGKHEITYSVSSRSAPGRKTSVICPVMVAPVSQLTMRAEEKPDTIIAGESFQVKVRISNEGNASVNALLKVDDGKDFQVKVEPGEVVLPPGSGTSILLNVSTRIGEKRLETLFLKLQAFDLKPKDEKILGSISIGVEKIPRAYGAVDLNRRVPARMTVRNSGEGTGQWGQVEIAGFGSLDELGHRQIDFLLRTPDQKQKSLFSWRDEFHLDYLTDDFTVRAGDESSSLSFLTSYSSYGRGLALDFHPTRPTRFGFFHLTNRWDEPGQSQFGMYGGHDLNDRIKLKVNHFQEESESLASLEMECVPSGHSSLNLEFARSTIASGSSPSDSAYRVQYQGRVGRKVRVTVEKIRAEPDYAGSVRDLDHVLGTLEFPLLSWIQGRARYSQVEQNLGFDRKRGAAMQESLRQVGANGQLPFGIVFSLDFDRLHRYDRFRPKQFDSSETAFRAALGKGWERFDIRWETRHSRRTEAISAQETWNDSHNYFATFRPTRHFFYSVYGGFSKNQGNRGSFVLRDSDNLGMTLRWKPSTRLSLDCWYLEYHHSGAGRNTSQGNFGLEYKLPGDASILFTARNTVSWSAQTGPTYYELSYAIPIDIPVGKKTSMGNLSGKVIDAELAGKPPIPNVVLIMGGTAAVTDRNGRFVFPAMACGTHFLTIERNSVGFNRLSSLKMPAEIIIRGGETSRIEIGMVKGAQVKGRFVSPPADKSVSETKGELILIGDVQQILKKGPGLGLGNILVELSLDGETVRRVSDHGGEFLFDALKPGTWRYKVYEENLPENHSLKDLTGEIALGSGEIKEISFEVLPRQRRIQIVDEGEIKSSR